MANIVRQHGAPISGKFTAIDSSQFNIDASESYPLTDEDIANRPKSAQKLGLSRNIQVAVGELQNNDEDGLIKKLNISQSSEVMLNN